MGCLGPGLHASSWGSTLQAALGCVIIVLLWRHAHPLLCEVHPSVPTLEPASGRWPVCLILQHLHSCADTEEWLHLGGRAVDLVCAINACPCIAVTGLLIARGS